MSSENAPAYSRVNSIGECSICLETMRDPKTLKCQHSCCKECLEGIVEVDKTRGAVVKCPMCQSEHVLEDGKTVSDLEPQLTLKQVLDLIDEYHSRSRKYAQRSIEVEKTLSPRCLRTDETTDHDGAMEWYCLNCKSFFCQKCLNLHSLLSMCGNKFYQVKYCEKYDSFTMYCGTHRAFHRYGCVWCCETFCNYCLAEKHTKEACLVRETDAVYKGEVIPLLEYSSKFKDPLSKKIATMKDYITKQESVLDEIEDSSLNSQSKIDDFEKYVEERKMVVLSQVLFFLELTGKQMMNSFKSELSEYETSTQKMKEEIKLKLDSVQDVLQKSESLADSTMIEIIARTKDLQDEFHTILPGDIEDHQMNLPPFCNVSDKLTVDEEFRQVLVAGVHASFGDVHISTMKDDDSYEATEKLLNFSNNVDYNPEMIAKLDDVSEARKYGMKVLKKMGLRNSVENTQEKEVGDGEVVEVEKGKGKKNKKNKNKDATVPEEKENCAPEIVEEEKGKGKNKKKNKNKDANPNVPGKDTGDDFATTNVEEEVEKITANTAKISLNELAKKNRWSFATYDTILADGGHISTVTFNGLQCKSLSVCKTKKDAEQNAAQVALMFMTGAPLPVGDPKTVDVTVDTKTNHESDEEYDEESDDSDEEEEETQSNNQSRGGRGGGRGERGGARRQRQNRRRDSRQGAAAVGVQSSNPYSANFFNSVPTPGSYILDPPHTPGMPSHRGRGEQRGGQRGGHRGEHRGGRGGRGGDSHRARARGRGNRGGPNRGGGGRGGPHQQPTAASSLNTLTQCYKCGQFGHLVSDCHS